MTTEETMPTALCWQRKKTEVERIVLNFQTIETINESRATQVEREAKFFARRHYFNDIMYITYAGAPAYPTGETQGSLTSSIKGSLLNDH